MQPLLSLNCCHLTTGTLHLAEYHPDIAKSHCLPSDLVCITLVTSLQICAIIVFMRSTAIILPWSWHCTANTTLGPSSPSTTNPPSLHRHFIIIWKPPIICYRLQSDANPFTTSSKPGTNRVRSSFPEPDLTMSILHKAVICSSLHLLMFLEFDSAHLEPF